MNLIYLFIFIPIFTFSQNMENLFPHHVGDIWQYKDEIGEYWTRTIVKDSVNSDSSHHIFFTNKPDYYLRSSHYIADSLNQIWGYDYDDNLWLYYNLDADSGNIFLCNSSEGRNFYAIVKSVGIDYFFGKERFFKEFVFFESNNPENYPEDALESSNAILVDSIGWVYSWWEPDGFSALTGCIINGKKYGTITDIDNHNFVKVPSNCLLLPAYPNPFNSSVGIPISLYSSAKIKLSIYNLLGQNITTLYKGIITSGSSIFKWDGKDDFGVVCPSGVYIIQLTTKAQIFTRKILFLK